MKVNKCARKILSMFLSLLLVMSLSVSALAAEAPQPKIDFVATMRVVAYSDGVFSSLGHFGHAFLVFTNTGNSTITIGHMPVGVGDSVTIGTFGNRPAHAGIWYNVEGYNKPSRTTYSLVTGVTASELVAVNSAINAHNYWSLSSNCTSFAKDVWNAGNSGITLFGTIPADLVNSIRSNSNYSTNPTIPSKSLSSIARHTSTGYVFDSSGANID